MERPESIETALDEALDAIVTGDAAAARRVRDRYGDAPELVRLMEVAGELRGALADAPSPAAEARHLRMIREAASTPARGARRVARPRPVRRFVLRPALVLGLVLLLAAPGMLALSANALPGEPLYGTKRAFETVRLAMARDPAAKADLHVQFAERRVEEIARLTGSGVAPAVLEPIVSSLQEHQQKAADAVLALREDGQVAGPVEENVAVALQETKERLMTIRVEMGCNGGPDAACRVLSTAVTSSDRTLKEVDEVPVTITQEPVPGGAPQPGVQPPRRDEPSSGSRPGEAPSGGGSVPLPGVPTVPGPAVPSGPPAQVPGTVPGTGGQPGVQPPPVVVPGGAAPLRIGIDIKPQDDSNTLNLARRRELPVVILSEPGFDVSSIDLGAVCFGDDPTDPANSDCTAADFRIADVDRDGDRDIVITFQVNETGIDAGDTEACLSARTTDGRVVKGCDAISVMGGADPSSLDGDEGLQRGDAPASQTGR